MFNNRILILSTFVIVLLLLPSMELTVRSTPQDSEILRPLSDSEMDHTPYESHLHSDKQYRSGAGYSMSIDSFDYEHMQLTVLPGSLITEDVLVEGDHYTRTSIEGAGQTGQIGGPALPSLLLLLAVPTYDIELDASVEVSHCETVTMIYPLQYPIIDSAAEEPSGFVVDSGLYGSGVSYPEKMVEIIDRGSIRDIDFVKIKVIPVLYHPSYRTLDVFDRISIRISWNSAGPYTRGQEHLAAADPMYEDLYGSMFPDWNKFVETFGGKDTSRSGSIYGSSGIPSESDGAEYLIITDPAFESAAAALKEWKNERGIITSVANTTETGNIAADIKLYLQDAYDNWTVRPSYVLLLGDAEQIPTNYEYVHPYHGTLTGSDHWYSTLAGNDYYSDVHIGRMPADDLAQAELLVSKCIDYEKDPPAVDNYYTNISVAGYFQDGAPYSGTKNGYEDRRFILTSEEIRDYLVTQGKNVERIYCAEAGVTPTNYNDGTYANGAALPPELLRANGFGWNGGSADITDSINDGISLLNHRDHGANWGWGDPHYDTTQIAALTNGNLQPIVYSINCQTGWFDHETDGDGGTTSESFCEVFVRKENGGAVSCLGATRVSYSGHNDYLSRGFYDAVYPGFDDNVGNNTTAYYRLGEILDYGKSYMAATWGDPWGIEQLEFELFHVFGDPTMEMWTSRPTSLEVSHPGIISDDDASIRVDVSEDDAYVSLVNGGTIIGRGSVSGGHVDIPVQPGLEGGITVTVTKHDRFPYQSELIIFSDNSSDNGTTGDDFSFQIGGLNDIYADSVYVNWSHGSLHGNVSLEEDNGNWTGSVILDHSLEDMTYTVLVNDTFDEWNISGPQYVNVSDNDAPLLNSDDSPGTGTTGDVFVFDIAASDNIEVDEVWANWSHGGLGGNKSLSHDGGGTWSGAILLDHDMEDLSYFIWFNDTSNNVNRSGMVNVTITDDDLPVLDMDSSPDTGTTGDLYNFNISASDNIGIGSIYANWSHARLGANKSLTPRQGYWMGSIDLDDNLINMTYTLYVIDTSNNIYAVPKESVVVLDNDDPAITRNNSPNSATTGDQFTFNVTVADNIGVESANVSWSHAALLKNEPMNDDGGGTWSLTVSLGHNTADLIYSVQVNDTSGNHFRGSSRVQVSDNDAPTLVWDNSPLGGTTGDNYTFDVSVLDNIAVDSVNVTWSHGALSGNCSLNDHGAGIWGLSITLDHSLDDLDYSVQVNDTSGNFFRETSSTVPVADNDFPSLLDHTPEGGTTGDLFVFSIQTSDNIGIASANVTWTHGEIADNTPMNDLGDGNWSIAISLDHSLGNLSYSIQLNDTSGNIVRSGEQNLSVTDNDRPSFSDNTPNTGTTGDEFHFNMSVFDNIEVASVHVNWSHGEQAGNLSLLRMENHWLGNLNLSHDLEPMTYLIYGGDTSGNIHISSMFSVDVSDNDAPGYLDNGEWNGTTGDPFFFNITPTDNVGIGSVRVVWSHGEVNGDLSLTGSGKYWGGSIILDHCVRSLSYSIHVKDTSDNTNSSPVFTMEVKDNDPPAAFSESNVTVKQHHWVLMEGNGSYDNIGVVNWTWTMAEDPGFVHYGNSLNHTFHQVGLHEVTLTVRDTAGNENSLQISVNVVDSVSPAANAGDDAAVDSRNPHTFNAGGSSDNVGIVNYSWSFMYGGRERTLFGPTPTFYFVTPGNYTVTLTVTDGAGNSAMDTVNILVLPVEETDDETPLDDDVSDDDNDDSEMENESDDDGGDGDSGEDAGSFFSSRGGIAIIGFIAVLIILGLLLFVRKKSEKEDGRKDSEPPDVEEESRGGPKKGIRKAMKIKEETSGDDAEEDDWIDFDDDDEEEEYDKDAGFVDFGVDGDDEYDEDDEYNEDDEYDEDEDDEYDEEEYDEDVWEDLDDESKYEEDEDDDWGWVDGDDSVWEG